MITVRDARPSDIEVLTRLYLGSAEYHAGLDSNYYARPEPAAVTASLRARLQGMTNDDSAILVAEVDGEVVGTIEIEVRVPPPSSMIRPTRSAWIGVVVDQGRRSGGVGRRLMEEAESWARAHGAVLMMLDMSAANEAARIFYARLGYNITGLILRKRLPRRAACCRKSLGRSAGDEAR